MNYQSFTTEELIKQAQHLQNSLGTKLTPLFEQMLIRLIQLYDSQVVVDSLEEKIEELEEEILEYRQKIENYRSQQEAFLESLE